MNKLQVFNCKFLLNSGNSGLNPKISEVKIKNFHTMTAALTAQKCFSFKIFVFELLFKSELQCSLKTASVNQNKTYQHQRQGLGSKFGVDSSHSIWDNS